MSQVVLDVEDAWEVHAVLSRAAALCEALEVELNRGGDGRPREWTARSVIAALLLLARHEVAFHIDRASDLIATLPEDARSRLDLNRPNGDPLTNRQINYAWCRVTECIDPAAPKISDGERLRRLELQQSVHNELLWASVDRDFRRAWKGHLAVDATLVWAHGRPPNSGKNKQYAGGADGDGMRNEQRSALLSEGLDTVYEPPTDNHPYLDKLRPVPSAPEERDLSGRLRRRDRGNRAVGAEWIGSEHFDKITYGYAHHLAVAVDVVGGENSYLPPLAVGQVTTPATSHPARSVMPMIEDIRNRRGLDPDTSDKNVPLGDVLADGGYSQSKAENWTLPIRGLGGKPVFQLHSRNQAGPKGPLEGHEGGYLLVDGRYYCPCMPKELHSGRYPRFGKDRDSDHNEMKADFRAIQEQREPYELRPKGSYRDKGLRFETPHHDSDCPVCDGAKCCNSKSVSITWDQLGIYQEERFGTEEWAESYARRTHVEGFFGNLKSSTVGKYRRQTTLFFGYAKVSLAMTFASMATNLHLLVGWHRSLVDGARKKTRRPGRPKDHPNLQDIYDDPTIVETTRTKKRRSRRKSAQRPRAKEPPSNPFSNLGEPES